MIHVQLSFVCVCVCVCVCVVAVAVCKRWCCLARASWQYVGHISFKNCFHPFQGKKYTGNSKPMYICHKYFVRERQREREKGEGERGEGMRREGGER